MCSIYVRVCAKDLDVVYSNKLLNLCPNKSVRIQGTPQMAVDKEARAYRESTHILVVMISVPCPYTKCKLP